MVFKHYRHPVTTTISTRSSIGTALPAEAFGGPIKGSTGSKRPPDRTLVPIG
jgi:hypothetical protein